MTFAEAQQAFPGLYSDEDRGQFESAQAAQQARNAVENNAPQALSPAQQAYAQSAIQSVQGAGMGGFYNIPQAPAAPAASAPAPAQQQTSPAQQGFSYAPPTQQQPVVPQMATGAPSGQPTQQQQQSPFPWSRGGRQQMPYMQQQQQWSPFSYGGGGYGGSPFGSFGGYGQQRGMPMMFGAGYSGGYGGSTYAMPQQQAMGGYGYFGQQPQMESMNNQRMQSPMARGGGRMMF